MTTMTQRVPVEEITARARQASPGRVMHMLILGLFFALGWLAGKLWFGLADCAVAVRLGWRRGRGLPPLGENPPPG